MRYNIIKHLKGKFSSIWSKTRNVNYNYMREQAKDYAENFALSANTKQYPLYKENDCVNFVCQAMVAGGMKMEGRSFEKLTSWFCYSSNPSALQKTSLTWRSSQYFRMYWGNANGKGNNKARYFSRMTVNEAINKFDEIYNLLMIGDVVQYGDVNDIAYHSQIIHSKDIDPVTGRVDLFMAQHTANRKYVSLREYLRLLNNKKSKYVYLYHF